jgi:FdrA protein
MTDRVIVRKGAYYDSVTLMLISRDAAAQAGVQDVAVAAATPLNLDLMRKQGFDLAGEGDLGPNDLVIALRTVDDEAADGALAHIEGQLTAKGGESMEPSEIAPAHSVAAAANRRADLSMAFLSVPGRYVAYEAASAIEAGLNVFCFSDGMSLEHEAALKRRAVERGLLFMGADCGTAIIDGTALGFANAVDRGPAGAIGASGTGLQQVTCLLDSAGVGMSQAIGVGGRDLKAELMTLHALELLGRDDATEAIVVVSKPPHPDVAAAVAETAGSLGKPVVLAFLGMEATPPAADSVEFAPSLEAAAARVAELTGGRLPEFEERPPEHPASGFIRGLYSGGTLCDEAMQIVAARGGPVASNIPLRDEWGLEDVEDSRGHTFIDFGEDELTEGRPHPMIDPTLRNERLEREARDPEVGVILLDVVLGYGSHPDPAGELADVIRAGLESRGSDELHVVVSLCATLGDPQGLEAQRERLTEAGAIVTRSNAHAARLAVGAAGL